MTGKQNTTTLIGIDAGSKSSGIIVMTGKQIREGYNMANEDVFTFVMNEYYICSNLKVIIEDVRPFRMEITNGIIETIRFIAVIEWRLRQEGLHIELHPRSKVKYWAFLQFKTMAVPYIESKIDYKIKKREREGKENKYRDKVTFVWMDDRIIERAMRKQWEIPKVKKVGQTTPYNLREHSWQALALISYYMALK